MGGVGGFWGVGGEKGQGSDVVMEFLSDAPAPRRHPRSPTAQPNRKPRRIPAASGPREPPSRAIRATRRIQRRKLGLKSPPGAIPNFGAGHEIKSQPRFVHAVLTCRFASQPPCRSRVPGRRAHRTPPFPTQNFLPSMDLKEQNNLVRGNRAKNFVRKSAYLFGVIRLDRRAEPHREQPPFFN